MKLLKGSLPKQPASLTIDNHAQIKAVSVTKRLGKKSEKESFKEVFRADLERIIRSCFLKKNKKSLKIKTEKKAMFCLGGLREGILNEVVALAGITSLRAGRNWV